MMNMIPDEIMRNHIIPYKLDLEARDKLIIQLRNIQQNLNDLEDKFVSELSDLIIEYDCVLLEKQETVVCNYLHEIYLEERMEQIKRELFCYLMDNKKIITMILSKYDQDDCCKCCNFDCRTCYMIIDLKTAIKLAYWVN